MRQTTTHRDRGGISWQPGHGRKPTQKQRQTLNSHPATYVKSLIRGRKIRTLSRPQESMRRLPQRLRNPLIFMPLLNTAFFCMIAPTTALAPQLVNDLLQTRGQLLGRCKLLVAGPFSFPWSRTCRRFQREHRPTAPQKDSQGSKGRGNKNKPIPGSLSFFSPLAGGKGGIQRERNPR